MFENFAAFFQNPMMFMMKSRFNVPNNMNNPDEIIDYIMRSGQLTQGQYNTVKDMYKKYEQLGQLPKQPN